MEERKSNQLCDCWEHLQEIVEAHPGLMKQEERDANEREYEIVSRRFAALIDDANGIECLIFLSEQIEAKLADSVSAARQKGNDWRTTSRLLGEADAFEEVRDLISAMFVCCKLHQ